MIVTREPLTGFGGAERSMNTIKRFLESRKNRIDLIDKNVLDYKIPSKIARLLNSFTSKNYFFNRNARKKIAKRIKEFKPEIILTQQDFSPIVVELARKHEIKVAYFIRSFEEMCFFNDCRYCDPLKVSSEKCLTCLKKHYPKSKIPLINFIRTRNKLLKKQAYNEAMTNSDIVIANSEYMKKLVKKWFGINSKVVYPSIILEEYKVTKKEPKYIGIVNPRKNKGEEIIEKIAEAMPEEHFLTCGNQINQPNIENLGAIEDMKEFYSKLKILLVPSTWPEPFGRVAVEAMASGIPVIASRVGGLPEAVGNGGVTIKDPQDITEWIKTITEVSKPKKYNSLSKKAKLQAESLDYSKTLKEIEKVIGIS